MTHSLPAIAALALSAAVLPACGGRGVEVPADVTPLACSAALAPAPQRGDRDREIARVQDEARRAADARRPLERLGYLYVGRARVSNDPGDYKLAEAAAGCLEARYPGEPSALLLKGHVLHQLHRFAEAEQVARGLVARRTYVLDYGLLGDALMEQGRLAEAAGAYQRMIDLKPFYQSYTRAAHLRWLKGDLDGAIEMIRLAIGTASPRDPESAAWAWTRLSAYELQAGRLSGAAAAARRALDLQPGYAAALLAEGRVHLARGQAADAAATLRRAARLNPLPEYQWALADALRTAGTEQDALPVEREIAERGASTDPRTLSLFLATRGTDTARAVALAEEELRVRADVFTLDAHAWALAADGRLAEARDAIARALAEGTRDGRLFLHAGVIASASGRAVEARRWFRQASALRATLLPSEAAALSRHATTHATNEEN